MITDLGVITDFNPSQLDEVGALSPAPVTSPQRSPSASACDPYREAIELGLSRGRNAIAIYQDLVEEYSFASSYALCAQTARHTNTGSSRGDRHWSRPGSARRLRHRSHGARSRDTQVSTHAAVRDDAGLQPESSSSAHFPLQRPHLGRAARARVSPTGRGHRIVVLDNLREGVLVPDIYDPALNPLYRDVLAQYGKVVSSTVISVYNLDDCVFCGHWELCISGRRRTL